MFDSLSDKLGAVFERLTRRGSLTEADVNAALREVRVALLEADVALPVVKDFVARVRERALGQEVVRSVTPGQTVIKIVHQALVEMLGPVESELKVGGEPPAAILVVGLQGSGKTTTSAKIAKRLAESARKRTLLASLDYQRPAAREQLAVLAGQAGVDVLPARPAEKDALVIAERAMRTARLEGYDVVILDTAGRLHVDEALMDEAAAVRERVSPREVLLVADALTGQDAVGVAESFHARVGLTGIVLTRIDGDARGGAALSMRAVTGRPIKLLGVGERLDALEPFHPERIASRILGMGDVVSLVEKAAATAEREEAERLAAKLQKGAFDLEDMASQFRQMRRMGGIQGILGLLPGVSKARRQMAAAGIDEKVLVRQEAIIGSMTPAERRKPKLLNASRKRRIAAGSGTSIQDVNRLLKQYREVNLMMKRAGKLGEKGLRRHGLEGLLPR